MIERSIKEVRYFCEVMLSHEDIDETLTETQRAWERGYSQAMKNVIFWIDNPGIAMVPKTERASEL